VEAMGKIRVYKLAGELDIESKELVNTLQDLGIDVSSHMSTVEDETAELIRDMYSEDDTEESNGNKLDNRKKEEEINEETVEKSKDKT
jgi:translation initiation factor IF-2